MNKGKYNIDLNYFKRINSELKAYFLGLLYADGCNIRTGFCLTLVGEEELQILEKFKTDLKWSGPIFNLSKRNPKMHELRIGRKTMGNDLTNLGCTPKKSLTLKFPTFSIVPKKYIMSFIRGYFDGDGSVYKINHGKNIMVSIVSSPLFIEGLFNYLNGLGIICKKYNYNLKAKVARLRISSQYAIKLYRLLYKNSNIWLNRKKQRFDDFYNGLLVQINDINEYRKTASPRKHLLKDLFGKIPCLEKN